MRALLLSLAVLASGCGGDDVQPPAPDLSSTSDLAMPDMAPFSPTLLQLTNHGGPVIASPELWVVVYAGDEALGDALDAFHRDMFATSYYWTGILGQYGVTGGAAMGVIVLNQPKPATLDHAAIPAMLDTVADGIQGKSASTVVALVVPKTTALTNVPPSEVAYHNVTPKGVPFEVLQQKDVGVGTLFDSLTYYASHEIAETATDPFPLQPAWFVDDLTRPYGEVADICNPLVADIYAVSDGGMPDNGTYSVARLWNEQAAEGGKLDPCWHYPKGVPYCALAVDPEVVLAAGGQGDGTLHVFSYGDVGTVDWEIDGAPPGITVSPQSGTAQVGDAIPFTVTGSASADFPLAVFATSEKTTFQSVWWFRVQAN